MTKDILNNPIGGWAKLNSLLINNINHLRNEVIINA